MRKNRRLRFESLESRRLLTSVDIPVDLMGQVLEQVSTPVNIDDATGVRAAEIRVTYDSNIVEIDETENVIANPVSTIVRKIKVGLHLVSNIS